MTFIVGLVFFTIIAAVLAAVKFFRDFFTIDSENKYSGADNKLARANAIKRSIRFNVVLGLLLAVFFDGSYTLYRGAMQVNPGQGGVLIWFGSMQENSVPEGLNFVNPMADRAFLSIRRRTVDLADDAREGASTNPVNGPAVSVTTKDKNLLRIDISVPYALNVKHLSPVYKHVGKTNDVIETKLLETHIRASLVDVATKFTRQDIMADKRQDVLKSLHDTIVTSVQDDLIVYGVPPKAAKEAILVSMPQIRQVTPAPEVKKAIDESAATEELKRRQEDLNKIAQARVERRRLEGDSINKMFSALPKGANSLDISRVMSAVAAKQRADALMKAVEKGQVQMIFMSGGSSGGATPAVQLPGAK